MGATVVTDADFQQRVLDSTKPVLVDFWAEWCGPCRMLAPVVEQVASEFGDSLTVAKLDVDNNPRSSMHYGVQSIPTLILFKDGKEVKRLVGFMQKERLAGELRSFVGQPATA